MSLNVWVVKQIGPTLSRIKEYSSWLTFERCGRGRYEATIATDWPQYAAPATQKPLQTFIIICHLVEWNGLLANGAV